MFYYFGGLYMIESVEMIIGITIWITACVAVFVLGCAFYDIFVQTFIDWWRNKYGKRIKAKNKKL